MEEELVEQQVAADETEETEETEAADETEETEAPKAEKAPKAKKVPAVHNAPVAKQSSGVHDVVHHGGDEPVPHIGKSAMEDLLKKYAYKKDDAPSA